MDHYSPKSEGCGDKKSNQDPLINKRFFSKYKAIRKIGEGSFGKVYKAEYNGEYYALKVEDRTKDQGLLELEATIMSYLKGPNIPIIKSFGYSGDYNVLVMQLMDKSLEDIFNKLNKFSVKTTAMLGYQMVDVLQYIHDKHIIHRDIKPDNFVMGSGELNYKLYILDFGLAKKYRSSRTLEQYPYVKKKKLTGTARYASIHALEAYEQSRRDDLESVGYVLMYFLRGELPWQGLKVKSKEDRYKKILDKKKEVSSEELCKNFPREFFEYVDYTKKLEYEENPDYDMLREKFNNVISNLGEKFDYIYDWTTKSDLQKRKNGEKLAIKRQSSKSNNKRDSVKNNRKNENEKNHNSEDSEEGNENELKDIHMKRKGSDNSKNEDKAEKIQTRHFARDSVKNNLHNVNMHNNVDDKVESTCCKM